MKKNRRIVIASFAIIGLFAGCRNKVLDESQIQIKENCLVANMNFVTKYSREHSAVIHPILNLRNTSNKPICFFWCVYHAGTFQISNKQGVIPNMIGRRSGPVGAKIIIIKPGQEVKLDAYDYGYGLNQNKKLYAFNTDSLQAILKSGKYKVNYNLNYNIKSLKKYLKHYDRIKSDINSLWIGKITLKEIPLILK